MTSIIGVGLVIVTFHLLPCLSCFRLSGECVVTQLPELRCLVVST